MINSTLYIFGNLGSGYTQYPFDYTKDILSSLANQTDAKSVLAISRANNLMYYSYLRKLEGEQHIGFCVLLNGMMFSNIKELFSVFESAVTFMVTSGGIIGFNSEGDITATTSTFIGKEKDIDSAFSYIQNGLSKLEQNLKKLPPVSYSISKSETKTFTYADKDESIVDASCKYGCTYIMKDKGYNTASLLGYKGVVTKLHKEKKELENKYAELNKNYQKVKRQKKQFKNVVFLLLIVIGCGVGIYFLYDNLNTTQSNLNDLQKQLNQAKVEIEQKTEQLAQANESIAEQETVIAMRNDTISSLTERCKNLQAQYEEKTAAFDNYREVIEGCQPFLVQSSSFNFNTGYFKFNYYGLTEGYRNITVCVISPDNKSKTYSNGFYVSKGSNSYSFYISRYFDNSKYYTFELLYNGKVIGGVRQ